MKTDHRSFLRLFGASTAAVATLEGVEITTSSEAPKEFARDTGLSPGSPEPVSRTTFRRHGGAFEVTPDVLYHRIDIGKNEMVGQYMGFSGYMGGVNGYDPTLTNLHQSNRLPQPSSFAVKRLGVVFSPKTEPALRAAFSDRYQATFQIDQKYYWRSPLSMLFQVGEPDRQKGFATLPDKGLADISELPLILTDEIHFSMNLTGTPIIPAGKITLWVVVEGLHARSIS